MRNGIETKVAASTGASLAVTIAFAVIHWLDPQLAMPPAVIIGGLTTLVTLGAGYLAPHTHQVPSPVKPSPTFTLSRAELQAMAKALETVGAAVRDRNHHHNRGHIMTRHRRLQRSLRSTIRWGKIRKNRKARLARRAAREATS